MIARLFKTGVDIECLVAFMEGTAIARAAAARGHANPAGATDSTGHAGFTGVSG